MTKRLYFILILFISLVVSCDFKEEEAVEIIAVEKTPRELLGEAYQLFKEGNDKESIKLANQVLAIGRETNNDTLIGNALTSLCRNAQRSLDTIKLGELSAELKDLAHSTSNQKWLMYRAHMNAEMWRLIGNMDRAEEYYTESMRISLEIGATGMYTIDHFNKSFVATAKGDFDTANTLIKKYYQLRQEENNVVEDAYGLIALAYLLEQQENYQGAHEVTVVTRRLFKEQNIFPEPPDEKPLIAVEKRVHEMLDSATLNTINSNATTLAVSDLLGQYLK